MSFCGEEAAQIRLRERIREQPHKRDPKFPWDHDRVDCVPTGLFVLESNTHGGKHCQDTERHRVENLINKVLIRWVEDSGRRRIARRKAEEEWRQQEEAERARREREAIQRKRQEEFQERQRAERERVDRLLLDSAAWQQSRVLRAFIRHMQRVASERGGQVPSSEFGAWLRWANDQADRLDPFAPSPPSVLDEHLD